MADIVAKIKVKRDPAIARVIKGITDDVRKSNRDRARMAQQTARDEAKAARDAAAASKASERDKQKAAELTARAHARQEADKRREIERTTREAQKSAAAQEAMQKRVGMAMRRAMVEYRQAQREAQRESRDQAIQRGRGRFAMAAGAVGIGVGIAASAIGRSQSAIGVESPDAVYQRMQAARVGFLRQSVAMGQSREQRAGMEAQIASVSRDTMVDPAQLFEAASTAAERFSDMDAFAKHLRDLAMISQATGASMQDLEGTAGELKRQFNLADGAVGEMMYSIVSSGALGSMGPADFAASFSQAMGQYVAGRGQAGQTGAAATDFIATAQVLASGGVGGDVAKTRMENMMNSLSNAKQQQKLRAIGIDVMNRDSHGRSTGMKSFSEIAHMMATNSRIGAGGVNMSQYVTDAQARQGLLSLVHAEGTDKSVSAISAASAAQGRGIVGNVMTELRGDSAGRDMATQSERAVGVLTQIGSMSESFHLMADGATQLGTQFPILSGMAGDLAGALQSAGQAALGFGALQGATTGAAAAVGGAGAAATLSAGSVAGVGLAGLGGWGVGRMIANATGSDDAIGGWLNSTFGRDQSQDAPGAWEAEARAQRGGGRAGQQQVTGTVELGPNTVSRITSAQQPAPGEGRRQPGGAAGR